MPTSWKEGVVIVGGGTAGWMTAAVLSKLFGGLLPIRLVESEQIGTVGVGEATLPPLRDINYLLGIEESEFLQATHATYKLGIRFDGWGGLQSSYLHSFGVHGRPIDAVGFHHYWLKAKALGLPVERFDAYSLAAALAFNSRFGHPSENSDGRHTYAYAYHLDAPAYAALLRRYAEKQGVKRYEATLEQVKINPNDGAIDAVVLADQRVLKGDFFIDCSGFSALLISKALGTRYLNWSHWLPCNRALAAPSPRADQLPLYTVATAQAAGWQWRIPLQNRFGNGVVFASDFMSDEQAHELLPAACNANAELAKQLRFTAGARANSWEKNCVAIGLASGFLEPLESTSIHLIQAAIYKLAELFPCQTSMTKKREAFNRYISQEYETIRDFIILHYKLNNRGDTEFWNYCTNMPIPDTLAEKIELFRATGHIAENENAPFAEPSWLAVLVGQGLLPNQVHPALANLSNEHLQASIHRIKKEIDAIAMAAGRYEINLQRYLANTSIAGFRPAGGLYG